MNKVTQTYSKNLKRDVNEFIFRMCNLLKKNFFLGIFLGLCLTLIWVEGGG